MRNTGQERLNENQFEDDGLPGIDANFPPEHSWGSEDPALVNGGSETKDNLVTRLSREVPDAILRTDDHGLVIVDGEVPMTGSLDDGDPDGGLSAEQAAMHLVDLE